MPRQIGDSAYFCVARSRITRNTCFANRPITTFSHMFRRLSSRFQLSNYLPMVVTRGDAMQIYDRVSIVDLDCVEMENRVRRRTFHSLRPVIVSLRHVCRAMPLLPTRLETSKTSCARVRRHMHVQSPALWNGLSDSRLRNPYRRSTALAPSYNWRTTRRRLRASGPVRDSRSFNYSIRFLISIILTLPLSVLDILSYSMKIFHTKISFFNFIYVWKRYTFGNFIFYFIYY